MLEAIIQQFKSFLKFDKPERGGSTWVPKVILVSLDTLPKLLHVYNNVFSLLINLV
jgi:hypothetical protein